MNKPENPFQSYHTTIRSTKTGNRTPDQPEIFMDEPECQYNFACIEIFLKSPAHILELEKSETGQKTGTRTTGKILCANEPVCQKKFAYMRIFLI